MKASRPALASLCVCLLQPAITEHAAACALCARGEAGQAQALAEHEPENEAALHALGLACTHLRQVLLDRKLLPCGAFRQLPGCACSGAGDITDELPAYVALDGSAFDNLEVIFWIL